VRARQRREGKRREDRGKERERRGRDNNTEIHEVIKQ
jgi:hypothetical protein